MILSDFDLKNYIKRGRLVIEPFDEEIIRENGIDMRVGKEMAVRNIIGTSYIDPTNEEHIRGSYSILKPSKLKTKQGIIEGFSIPPSSLSGHVLITTLEYIRLPNDLMAFVQLRSTWARHGIFIPPTIVDAGFEGELTLEVLNFSPQPILLGVGWRFCHLIFAKTTSPVEKIYHGTYRGQRGIKLPKPINNATELSKIWSEIRCGKDLQKI